MPAVCQESLIVYQCGVMSRLGVILYDVTQSTDMGPVGRELTQPCPALTVVTRHCPLLMM